MDGMALGIVATSLEIELELVLGAAVSSPVVPAVEGIILEAPSEAATDGAAVVVPLEANEGIMLGTIVSLLPVVIGVLDAVGAGVPLVIDEGIMVLLPTLEADEGIMVLLSTLETDDGAPLVEGVGEGVGSVESSDGTVGEDDGTALSTGGQSTTSSGKFSKKVPS